MQLESYTICLVQGVQFSVVITEGRPDETGRTMARALDEQGIPVTAILDSGVAYAMSALRYRPFVSKCLARIAQLLVA